MKTLIAIPMYNYVALVPTLVSQIRKTIPTGVTLGILLIDDFSDPPLQFPDDIFSDEKIPVFLLRNERNLGFAGSVNVAFSFAEQHQYDSLLLINSDVLLEKDTLKNLFCVYKKAEDDQLPVGVIGALLYHMQTSSVQHAGAFLGPFGWGVHNNTIPFHLQNEELIEVEYVTGAFLFISPKAFATGIRFDEAYYPAYFEEVDYSYQLRKLGLKTYFSPKIIAFHEESSTTKAFGDPVSFTNKNQIYFYRKWDGKLFEETSNTKVFLQGMIGSDLSSSSELRRVALGLSAQKDLDVVLLPEDPPGTLFDLSDFTLKQMLIKDKNYKEATAVIRFGEGDQAYLIPPSRQRIQYTYFETTHIPKAWVHQLSNVDMVLVPSKFCADVLKSFISTPVFILPNSFDPSVFRDDIKPAELPIAKRSFVIGSVGFFGYRKGYDVLLKAIKNAFKRDDDVICFFHWPGFEAYVSKLGKTPSEYVREHLGTESVPVYIHTTPLSTFSLASLMKVFNVLVAPSRGEAFCLPVLEAAALGIPSIVTGWGGLLEFCTDDVAYHIDYRLTDAYPDGVPYFMKYLGKWAEPDVDHLSYLLRYCYEHPDQVDKKGFSAWKRSKQYTMYKVTQNLRSIIEGEKNAP